MNARLIKAIKTVDRAHKAVQRAARAAERTCRHANVLHSDGFDTGFGYTMPQRLCLDCGLHEEAWNWPGLISIVVRVGDIGRGPDEAYRNTKLNTKCPRVVNYRELISERPTI